PRPSRRGTRAERSLRTSRRSIHRAVVPCSATGRCRPAWLEPSGSFLPLRESKTDARHVSARETRMLSVAPAGRNASVILARALGHAARTSRRATLERPRVISSLRAALSTFAMVGAAEATAIRPRDGFDEPDAGAAS